MNACKYGKLLIPYSKGVLSQAERAAIGSHLETCSVCRETLSQIRNLESLTDAYRRPPVSRAVKESYYSALDRQFPTGRSPVFHMRFGTDWMQVRRTALIFTAAAAIIVLALISGRQIGRVNRGRPFVMPSRTVIVQNSHPQVEQFLQAAEIFLYELKDESGEDISGDIIRQARNLIVQLPGVHDIAAENSNAALLSFLVQSELILYEAANYREGSAPVVRDLIRKCAGSEKLWETLRTVRNSAAANTPDIMKA